jgi:predicted O-methyltransferase YrrM
MDTGLIFLRVAKYLKYIMVSKNRKGYGIHSPFLFDLVNRVFRNKLPYEIVYKIEKIRKKLLFDKRIIVVKDLGTRSGDSGKKLKRVSEIVRNSSVPERYGTLLANMAAEFGQSLIVEFGTSFGISTMYMASSCPESSVLTMEGCSAIAEIAGKNFEEAGLKNINQYIGPFEDILPHIINLGVKPGLVFIDGNHRKEPVLGYFGKIVEISDNKTVIIIDDINYSREMEEAWNEIKQNDKVSLTVDIFRMGIIFLREGIMRKNYIIRY